MINQFKIFPLKENSRFFEVNIFESKINYLNYLQERASLNHYQMVPYQAITEFIPDEDCRLGIISFFRENFNITSIAHECLHAAIWYLRLTHDKPFESWNEIFHPTARKIEEKLCSIQQYLIAQIIHRDNKYFVKSYENEDNDIIKSSTYYS